MKYEYVPFKKTPYFFDMYNDITFPKNYHSEIEITYCMKGEIPYGTETGDYNIKAGEILFIGSGEIHERYPQIKNSQGLFLKFGSLLLGKSFSELANLRFKTPLVSLNSKVIPNDIREGIKTIADFSSSKTIKQGSPEDWQVRSILFRLAWFLLKEFDTAPALEQKGFIQEEQVNTRMIRSVQNAVSYVEDNYMTEISLEKIAQMLGYEKSYFCKIFRDATGQTFHRFLNGHRIQIACNYLSSPDIPIGEVAVACGFTQFKTFCRVFKEETGITPTEYRDNKNR